MRICSLLPGATDVLLALGLADQLVAVSHECEVPPGRTSNPVVVRPLVMGVSSSADIDRAVRDAAAAQRPLYELDAPTLRAVRPDLIIAQDLCHVCAVTPHDLEQLLSTLVPRPALLTLNPLTLADVLADINRIAGATGANRAANDFSTRLRHELDDIQRRVAAQASRPRVVCLEWLDPLYVAGHWVPEMVAAAGGDDRLGTPGASSRVVAWDQVRKAEPEILIVMPCGFSIDRTLSEMHLLARQSTWTSIPAVRRNNVFVVDSARYFSRPGPRLVDGVRILAAIIHPDLFGAPAPAEARRWSSATL